jgi:hypothetical protein
METITRTVMNTPLTFHIPKIQEILNFTFRVLFFWYIIAVLAEAIFPGIVSLSIDLDFFLWSVILLGIVQFVTNHFSR